MTLSKSFLEASPVEGQSLHQKDKKMRKRKSKKKYENKKKEKPNDVARFLIQKLLLNFYFCAC